MLVAVPVSSVQLLSRDLTGSHVQSYTHGQRVVFSDAEARDVTCRVNGSHPAPRVAVYVDQVDISDQFTQTHTDRVTVGPSALPGLQVCTCVCVCVCVCRCAYTTAAASRYFYDRRPADSWTI